MSSFSVTPLTDVPPPGAQEFPNFVQFQSGGTDLGLPDADTLNFVGGLTATRGEGENANVVTVTGEGGGGSYGVISLSAADGYLFDGSPFGTWVPQVLVANADWSFDPDANQLEFSRSGVYRVIATCHFFSDAGIGLWPLGEAMFGSIIGDDTSTHSRGFYTYLSILDQNAQWTDQAMVLVPGDEFVTAQVQLYARADDTTHPIASGSMRIVIERLGDYPV